MILLSCSTAACAGHIIRKENNTMNDKLPMNKRTEYDHNFWNHIKGSDTARIELYAHEEADPGMYQLPAATETEYDKAVTEKSIMRRLATVVSVFRGTGYILAADSDDTAEFVPEGQSIGITDVMDDFNQLQVLTYKLAVILKMPSEFVSDAAFNLKGYMVKRLAKSYAAAEDNAFINGSGEHEPEGVLRGAETGCEASELTFDGIISLFYSVKPEYRENATWLMNDETAQILRTLKDDNGNYLWNQANDTILGRPVSFSRFMPAAEAGSKPVALGDFSYYWIIRRAPLVVRMLRELFALNGQNGYLTYELIDGRLVRPEAVKVIKIK